MHFGPSEQRDFAVAEAPHADGTGWSDDDSTGTLSDASAALHDSELSEPGEDAVAAEAAVAANPTGTAPLRQTATRRGRRDRQQRDTAPTQQAAAVAGDQQDPAVAGDHQEAAVAEAKGHIGNIGWLCGN